MTYVVIENTPGYMPDDNDPGYFETMDEAVEYAEGLAQEAMSALYEDADKPYVTRLSETLWQIGSERPHDLGRVVEIVPAEDEAYHILP